MPTYQECVERATAQVRGYDCWILREPGGNYYTSSVSRGRQIPVGDVPVAVVRRGTTALERKTPRVWAPKMNRIKP